ncbi:MAG: hypothetical protein WCO10_03300 [bacterium]
MATKHLNEHLYYSDLYDKHTVEECRRIEKHTSDIPLVMDGKQVDEAERQRLMTAVNQVHLYFVKGERYAKKTETIQEWMSKDKEIDDFVESAKAPGNITCLTCGRLAPSGEGSLNIGYDGKKHRMLYFYECPLGHLPHRAFYDDGEEYKKKYHHCPTCKAILDEKVERKKNKIVTTYSCQSCNYQEVDEFDLSVKPVKKEEVDNDYTKDRDRFCLSEKEGGEYLSSKYALESLKDTMKDIEERHKNKEVYDEVATIKKLTIIDLEKLIAPELEKAQYVKFHMKDPEVSRDVYVPFVVYDGKSDRSEWDSKNDLKKLFKQVLEGTNWRLMSDGANYRLGMLEGRLRAFEREEDLVNLVKKAKKS